MSDSEIGGDRLLVCSSTSTSTIQVSRLVLSPSYEKPEMEHFSQPLLCETSPIHNIYTLVLGYQYQSVCCVLTASGLDPMDHIVLALR